MLGLPLAVQPDEPTVRGVYAQRPSGADGRGDNHGDDPVAAIAVAEHVQADRPSRDCHGVQDQPANRTGVLDHLAGMPERGMVTIHPSTCNGSHTAGDTPCGSVLIIRTITHDPTANQGRVTDTRFSPTPSRVPATGHRMSRPCWSVYLSKLSKLPYPTIFMPHSPSGYVTIFTAPARAEA
jgi:hypothetical protein